MYMIFILDIAVAVVYIISYAFASHYTHLLFQLIKYLLSI